MATPIIAVMIALASLPCMADDNAWPGFRGLGDSQSRASNLPIQWELRGRVEGAWDVRLPGYGQSSPAIWGDHVYVTAVSGDMKETLHVLAIELGSGKTLWSNQHEATQKVKDSDNVSRGAPTPVAGPQGVFFVFESGDVFAYSHQGELQWSRSFVKEFGEIKGPHGFSSSPVLTNDGLLLQVTHAGPSYIMSMSLKDGSTQWKVDHPSQTGWSSPTLIKSNDRTLAVISSAGSVRAYDVKDGMQVWFVEGLQGNSTASPTVYKDCILIGSSGPREGGPRGGESRDGGSREGGPRGRPADGGSASSSSTQSSPTPATSISGSVLIRAGGQGNVSESQVVWAAPKIQAGYASPAVSGDMGFFVNRAGIVQCADLSDGKELWNYRLPSAVWASPVVHQGNVIFFCKDGAVVVLAAQPELKVVAENSISTTDIVYGVAATEGAWIVRKGRGLQKIVSPAP